MDNPRDAPAFSSSVQFRVARWYHMDLPDGCDTTLGSTRLLIVFAFVVFV